MAIEIRDLSEETMDVYLCCGTQPTKEKVAGEELKRRWTKRMLDKGLGVKVGYSDGWPAGFTNYLPIEVAPAPVSGEGLLFVMCIHVNDADDERGANYERKGVGSALVDAVEEHARAQGFCGVPTIALDVDHLPAAFWRKMGYELVEQARLICLLWKPFGDCVAPSLWRVGFEPTPSEEGCVHVDVVYWSFCSFHQYVREIAASFGDKVVFREHTIDDREAMDIEAICGHVGLFVDGKRGPNWPVGDEEWRSLIEKALEAKGLLDSSGSNFRRAAETPDTTTEAQ